MSCEYKLSDFSSEYILYDQNTGSVLGCMDEVAIAFTYDPEASAPGLRGTLHKHGYPSRVNKWAKNACKKYVAAGLHDMAEQIIVIQGRFPLEELDKILNIAGYIGTFYEKHFKPETFRQLHGAYSNSTISSN